MKSPKIFAAGLLCLLIVSSAHAQIMLDVTKITCRDFLQDTITVPENIAYWLSGYYNGKRDNTVFDVVTLKSYVNKVEDYCEHNKDVTVMHAVETLLGGKQ